jgi:dihydroneopterin aldolase
MTIPLPKSKPISDPVRAASDAKTWGAVLPDATVRGAKVWDPNRSHVRVVLRDVEVQASVGLHPWERFRERPTRLIVNVEMFAAADGPVDGGGAGGIIDYDTVRATIVQWPQRPHVDLLETLVEELVGVCFSIARVQACRVSVMKPDIFNDAAAVGVEVFRVRQG